MGGSSLGGSSKKSNHRSSVGEYEIGMGGGGGVGVGVGGSVMLPIFLNDLRQNQEQQQEDDLVEVTLEVDEDSHSIVVCDVHPTATTTSTSMLATRDARKMNAKLQRTRSRAQQALKGLRFINDTTATDDPSDLWKKVESRFNSLANDGLLSRDDFGQCIGMDDSKEFAARIFEALARRRGQKLGRITKDELHDFWLEISDHSFDARLQIFFDMADSNADGKITREEVQELIMLSASANKLSKLKDQAQEYATLIMEELDPENLGYIELETLLLQRDIYMNYSRPLSTSSDGWSQNLSSFRPKNALCRVSSMLKQLVLENWQRGWILLLWLMAMGCLFAWKFNQYRNRTAFQTMGYCLTTAKGAAETLKLNMALILLPVCRNTLTWLRSTKARLFFPFDDNINFHKASQLLETFGSFQSHLIMSSSPKNFAAISSDFNNRKPTYVDLLTGVVGMTGISMVILMAISFTLATHRFRKNVVRLPSPLNRLTGFNAFWYSHHLFALVYLLLLVHGTFLFLVHQWHQKTTWMYISLPLLLYVAERNLRTCRSEHSSVKILKVSVLPGNVFSLIMSVPPGFKYTSGQYIFLQCPTISPFEWHPFSITSAPGDDYLSVHIRTAGDWTQELKRVYTEGINSKSEINQAKFSHPGHLDQRSFPRLLVDGPYGAPAQDYRNYDVLLLVGLGIGATPFISILKDLLINTRSEEEQMDSNTETGRSEDSLNSFTSSSMTPNGKKKSQRTCAHFYWVTREPGSFEWFKGVMNEVAEIDHKGQIELHNYLTSVYEEGDARSTLLTLIQALNHAKNGVDILSGTRVRTHFARPNWKEVFNKITIKHPYSTVGVFYCGLPMLAKELRKLSKESSQRTSTRFEFHKEYF
ncbi:FAD-binding 8 [Dillenia turbinata]|uniref:FAD-binding 8 n=1 Tax=Dillenia turbinata TaxID=194707 RepID=A0AAN8WAG7_9MAGN